MKMTLINQYRKIQLLADDCQVHVHSGDRFWQGYYIGMIRDAVFDLKVDLKDNVDNQVDDLMFAIRDAINATTNGANNASKTLDKVKAAASVLIARGC